MGKGSLWTVDPQCRPSLLQALNRSPLLPRSTLDPSIYFKNNQPFVVQKQQPAPDLHLELKPQIKYEVSDESLDAVDAATVMLSLRNGPRHRCRKDKSKYQVITTSPSQDHTYSASENVGLTHDEAFESDDER